MFETVPKPMPTKQTDEGEQAARETRETHTLETGMELNFGVSRKEESHG
jgi:hypothetical protein